MTPTVVPRTTSRHGSCRSPAVMTLRQFKSALPYAWGVAYLLFHSPPAAAAISDISFKQYRLPNGLEVLLHVDHSVPMAHSRFGTRSARKTRAPADSGFAHLFEHMMFKGTKQIPKGAYFKYLAEAGLRHAMVRPIWIGRPISRPCRHRDLSSAFGSKAHAWDFC